MKLTPRGMRKLIADGENKSRKGEYCVDFALPALKSEMWVPAKVCHATHQRFRFAAVLGNTGAGGHNYLCGAFLSRPSKRQQSGRVRSKFAESAEHLMAIYIIVCSCVLPLVVVPVDTVCRVNGCVFLKLL